jgi:hypothetical protein
MFSGISMAIEGWLAGCFTKRIACQVEASFETVHPYLSKSWESGIGKRVSQKTVQTGRNKIRWK